MCWFLTSVLRDGLFLVDRTARSMIGYWHDYVVCLCVCQLVCLYIYYSVNSSQFLGHIDHLDREHGNRSRIKTRLSRYPAIPLRNI